MKTFLAFVLFFIISTNINSQEISWVNVGIGYPFIFNKSQDSYSSGYLYQDKCQNLFVEIPFLIDLNLKSTITISPGVSYIQMELSRQHGGLGGGSFGTLDRRAVSIYTKTQINPNLNFTGNHNWNFGFTVGYYIHTHVEGKIETWFMQEGPDYHSLRKVEGDSKDFFKSFCYGLVSDFQFNFKKVRFLKPAIELSFYPDFANIAADFSQKNENRNMLMGSIILGFGSKHLSKESEK